MKKTEMINHIKDLEKGISFITSYVEGLNQRIEHITKYNLDLRRELETTKSELADVKSENEKLHSIITTVIPGKIETRVEAATDEMTDIFNDRVEKLESFEKKVTEFEKTIDVLLEQNKVLSSITDSHTKTIKGIESDVQSNWESAFRCDCSMSSDLGRLIGRVSVLEEKVKSERDLTELRETYRANFDSIINIINCMSIHK